MKPDERDIICEQDYTPLSNAELVAHIQLYADLMHNTPLSDGEWLDDIIGPARVLMARAEAAEARVAELEAQLAAQQWRPIGEPAPKGEIEVKMRCAVGDDGQVYKIRTDIFVGWWTVADDSEWRPLPPAPQEPTP